MDTVEHEVQEEPRTTDPFAEVFSTAEAVAAVEQEDQEEQRVTDPFAEVLTMKTEAPDAEETKADHLEICSEESSSYFCDEQQVIDETVETNEHNDVAIEINQIGEIVDMNDATVETYYLEINAEEEEVIVTSDIYDGVAGIDFDQEESDVSAVPMVVLEDLATHLEQSNCFCKDCKILLPTPKALDAHNTTAHSLLIARSHRAVKSTSKSSYNVVHKSIVATDKKSAQKGMSSTDKIHISKRNKAFKSTAKSAVYVARKSTTTVIKRELTIEDSPQKSQSNANNLLTPKSNIAANRILKQSPKSPTVKKSPRKRKGEVESGTLKKNENSMYCGQIEDMPEGRPHETPLHPKRKRPTYDKSNELSFMKSPWYQDATSTPASSTPASSTPASSTPASSTPALSTPESSTSALLQTLAIEPRRGRSGRAARGGGRGRGVSRPVTSGQFYYGSIHDLPEARPHGRPLGPKKRIHYPHDNMAVLNTPRRQSPEPVAAPTPEAPITVPAASAPDVPALTSILSGGRAVSDAPRRRSHLDDSELVNYGSESDLSEDDEFVPVPRAQRMFMEDHDHGGIDAQVSTQWPPIPVPEHDPEPPLPSAAITDALDSNCNLDKFKFDWQPFSPNLPEERRERFVGSAGPTQEFATPYDAFMAIWDMDFINHICNETNKYAQQLVVAMMENSSLCPNSRITKWVDTTPDEMLVFMAKCMATGVVVKTRIEEYWNKEADSFQTPGFSVDMSHDRYRLLCKCLHFADNASCNRDTMNRAEVRLHKLKPVIDHLNKKFQELYSLGQNIALDESLTQWKGRLDINQFIPNKAAAVGIKTYEVCESQTGYLWRFKVHAGHMDDTPNDNPSPISGAVPSLVLELLRGLEGKGHSVWMDNFYNSPALARELKTRGFDCIGTLRTNRRFVPTELANLKMTDMRIGQVNGCTSGDVDLVVWRDKSRVALISTFHGLATVKCNVTRAIKPTVAHDYNVCMGGVDKKDQMLAMYPIERKRTHIWYKKFFRRLLNVSVLNAYITYKHHKPTTHRQFRIDLVRQIEKRHGTHTPQPNNVTLIKHMPNKWPEMRGGRSVRRKCVVCGKRSFVYCEACNVTMCLFACFKQHHATLNSDTHQ